MLKSLTKVAALTLLATFAISAANAQGLEDLKVTGSYQNESLEMIVIDLEKKYPLRFFFDPIWIEDIIISASFTESRLDSVLNRILNNTDLTWTFYGSNYIILLNEKAVLQGASDIGDIEDDKNKRVVIGEFSPDVTSATLTGYVEDANSGEGIIGASIYIEEISNGTVTNQFGFFSITLPVGVYHMQVAAIGWDDEKKEVVLNNNGSLQIEMFEETIQLSEITITDEAIDRNVSSVQMSAASLDIKAVRKMPAFLGEVDLVRSLILLPGVSTVGEGSTGFNVRGGSVGENLILLDDAPVFNSAHLFGFFSVFNPDVVKDATLYKGGIPARYGGRISSMLDVTQKEGNSRQFNVRGGIGMVSSRLLVEGPIAKDKSSFLIGGRISYTDWVIRKIEDVDLRNSSAQFYDLNAKINHKFGEKDNLYLSGYLSNDQFSFATDTLITWRNSNGVLKWSHLFNPKLFSSFTAALTKYDYIIEGQGAPNLFKSKYDINYKNFKADFSYFPNVAHQLDFGIGTILYDFEPGNLSATDPSSTIIPLDIENEKSIESSVHINDEWKVSQRITLSYGLRYSFFQNMGPGEVLEYQEGLPKSSGTVIDTSFFSSGKVIASYDGIEPRFSMRYTIFNNSSIKLSYNRMKQYIHLISNTAAVSPIDIWKTSDKYIEPQTGDQIALGYFRNFKDNIIETSIEGFYKLIDNVAEYKDGAELLLNENLETELLQGDGRSYGIEFLVRKKSGRLTGWTSYTYSRSERKINGLSSQEQINNGNYFPSNWDIPHNFSLTTNYKFTRRYSFSLNFVYNTGRPFTVPESVYSVNGVTISNFSDRNQARIPDFHRLDLSFTVDGNLKKKKNYDANWTFSIYNLYGRENPFSVYFDNSSGTPKAFQLSVLGRPFPALTYNFKFM